MGIPRFDIESFFTRNACGHPAASWRCAAMLSLLCCSAVPTAFAQTFVCPSGPAPGQRQVGMTGDGRGVAAVPVCTQDAAQQQQQQPTAPPRDPMNDYASAMANVVINQADQLRRIEQDPEFRALRAGSWSYFQGDKGATPGENCSAFFKSLEGAVQIAGPNANYRGASLTFFGLDIPRPATVETLRVKLDQGEGHVQDVSAVNYAVPGGKLGAIVFQVPTLEAGLKGMRDTERFKVSIQDKQVIDVGYHSGLKARDQMQRCAAGQPIR